MSLPNITDHFRKNSDGSWTCIAPTLISGPLVKVSIEPGMSFVSGSFFIGIDVAANLDAVLAQKNK